MYRLVCSLILLLAIGAQADTLTLKQSFPVGWKYSFDQKHYHTALFGTGGIKERLGDDSVAIKQLNSYSGYQVMSILCLSAGFTVAVIEIKQAAENKWDVDDDLGTTIAGGVVLIGGFLFESISGKQLQKAAARYNAKQTQAGNSLSLAPTLVGHSPGIGLTLRF